MKQVLRVSKRLVSNHAFETAPLVPRMWTGKAALAPETYTIDVSNESMIAGPLANPQLAAKMAQVYNDVGLVLLRGQSDIGNDLAVGKQWVTVCMPHLAKYEGGANPRKGKGVDNVYEVGAPGAAYLHYHHEMAYVNESVKSLGFCCTDALEATAEDPLRGASYVSCNLGATDDVLKTSFGQKLKERGITYIRCLTNQEKFKDVKMVDGGGAVYNHWQISFGTDCPKEAQKRAESKGLVVEWGADGYMKTKFTVSGFEYFPTLDRNLLYSAIADHGSWFDTWPGMAELDYMSEYKTAHDAERPLAITYGDGSEFTLEDLETFVKVYDDNGIPLHWQKGDIAVVCNYRFAHGRLGYELQPGEKRELGVILGEMYERSGNRSHAW